MTGEMVAMGQNARKKTASKKGSLGLASDMKLPMATVSRCGANLLAMRLVPVDRITVKSSHVGAKSSFMRAGTMAGRKGRCSYEAAANLMTHAAMDPFGKLPEFKYCAVAIRRGGAAAAVAGCGPGSAHAPSTLSQVESE